MKYVLLVLLTTLCVSNLCAQDREQRRKEILEKFDKDGDGRLSKEEHEAVRASFEKERDSRKKTSQTDKKRTPKPKVDESFIKGAVVSMPSSLDAETKTLRNEFVFFKQVNQTEKTPLIIYLHGGGAHNGPTSRHLSNPTASLISKGKYPFNLLIPVFQKAEGMPNGWNPDDLTRLLKFIINEYNIDAKRVFLTGHSMGGAGTLMWGNKYPELFAGLVPRSAGGAESPKGELPVQAKNFVKVPIWAFHGSKDGACDYRKIESLLKEIKSLGAQPKFTLLEGLGHNISSAVNSDDKILKWFMEQK
ncbi:prolyl oligopeptidase family serine peptidase [Lentisphaera profundi]|uniref:Prolyl oligopeptidase family serine peptidase n=1 Tax=Lentisphaera profundi TaxID=1658616 RepID=A0ABY7VMX7_9BACT|nr:prolyl oligopeptidase family serine peptidase [Lentisphaera profundi]WDE95415.1 prolyl oligopeptidase family serine peptidase [Lentisphaera profundi]